jgi:hypothetical protein
MENKIKGGKADKMSVEDIARKHSVFLGTIKKELEMGMKIEKEHAKDDNVAREIAMDHLTEFPDYYTRLKKMETQADAGKKSEAKESMGADASGSYEGPFSGTILKKDIHKLHNFKTGQKEVKEITGAGVSAGAMYDAPIGTGSKDPLKIDNPRTASITAASNKNMKATKKGFPRFGGPDAKFVEIDKRCKTYPYCNQGADNQLKLREDYALKFFESKDVQKSIREAAKKYGVPVKNIQKMVLNEIIAEALPRGMFDEPNLKAMKGWVDKGPKAKYKIITHEPVKIVTDDDVELAKLKLIFYNHDVKFEIEKLKE